MDEISSLLLNVKAANDSRQLQNVIKLLPDNVLNKSKSSDLYAEKSQALWRLGEYNKSSTLADRALNLDSDHAKANNYKANWFLINGELNKAIEYFQKAISSNPQYSDAYNGLGNCYDEKREFENAKDNFLKSLEKDPQNAHPNYSLGNWYFRERNYLKASEYYEKTVDLAPDFDTAYVGLGNCFVENDELINAINMFETAIKINPTSYFAINGLAKCAIKVGDYHSAVRYYERSIELNSNSEDAYDGLGDCSYYNKDYDMAIFYYNKAISINEGCLASLNGLGMVYHDKNNFSKAIEYYQKVIALDPFDSATYYNIATSELDLKKYESAQQHFEKYLELDSKKNDYYARYAKNKIELIKKKMYIPGYAGMSILINKIKEILLFEEPYISHFTSLTVTGLLVFDEKNELRLSEGAFLNDPSEGSELQDLIPHPFHFKASDGNSPLVTPFSQKPFIGSYAPESKQNDLALWRMYGKDSNQEAAGCSITLDRAKFLESIRMNLFNPLQDDPDVESSSMNQGKSSELKYDLNFYRVAYRVHETNKFIVPGLETRQAELDDTIKELFSKAEKFFKKNAKHEKHIVAMKELLNDITYLFKTAEYQYEHEVRLVVNGALFKKYVDTQSKPPKVFVKLARVNPILKRITLGTKVIRAEEWAAAFNYHLTNEGFDVEIHMSCLPFK